MGVMVRERAVQESALMAARRGDYLDCGALQPEPQLPCGWEKCLDLKSGLIYYKDWNSGTLTYRDPRKQRAVRTGLLAISDKREARTHRLPWTQADSSATETTSMQSTDDEQSLELSLNLPGTSSRTVSIPNQEESVCTMEKVRSALERSNWLQSTGKRSNDTTALSLLSSSSRESNSSASPSSSLSSSSQCSDSECFTSPSVMSYEGDDEEVLQQPHHRYRRAGDARSPVPVPVPEVMVTVGCKSCLLYVMLSKANPCCPKCGNTDVLLQLPEAAPVAKKARVSEPSSSPTWSWCTA